MGWEDSLGVTHWVCRVCYPSSLHPPVHHPVHLHSPNHTSAERFGFAQLHQLRGRVGRSSRQSFCYLVYSADAGISVQKKMKVRIQGYCNGDMQPLQYMGAVAHAGS